jgi:hypothetical protein
MIQVVERMKHRRWRVFILLICITAVVLICESCIFPAPLPEQVKPPTPPSPSENDAQLSVVSSIAQGTVANGWKEVAVFEGKESAVSEPFPVVTSDWRITWKLDATDPELAIFSLFVYEDYGQEIYTKKIIHSGSSVQETCYIEGDSGTYYIKVISANLDRWAVSVEEHDTKSAPSDVQIIHIHYQGRSLFETTKLEYDSIEADEYVEIKNTGNEPQNINGWRLRNETKRQPTFTFSKNNTQQINEWFEANIVRGKPSFPLPGHSPFSNVEEMDKFLEESGSSGGMYITFQPNILAPHTAIRVYTGEFHPESGGFSFNYLPGDIWDNDEPDVAVLYNSSGTEISRKSYILP